MSKRVLESFPWIYLFNVFIVLDSFNIVTNLCNQYTTDSIENFQPLQTILEKYLKNYDKVSWM